MQVGLISGALGSGKTSLLLPLAEILQEAGSTVGILENDAGQIPVDAPFLRSRGFTVEDLASGCICCDLSRQLPAVFGALRKSVNPDVILVEPSGLATPGLLQETFANLLVPGDQLTGFYLVDLLEFARRDCRPGPFYQRAMTTADIVVPTKQGLAGPDVPVRFRQAVEQAHPNTVIVSPEDLLDRVRCSGKLPPPENPVRSAAAGSAGDRSFSGIRRPDRIFAAAYRLDWSPGAAGHTAVQSLRGLLDGARQKVRMYPSSVIGTLKISMEAGGGSILAVTDDVSPVSGNISSSMGNPPDRITVNFLTSGESIPWDGLMASLLEEMPDLENSMRL